MSLSVLGKPCLTGVDSDDGLTVPAVALVACCGPLEIETVAERLDLDETAVRALLDACPAVVVSRGVVAPAGSLVVDLVRVRERAEELSGLLLEGAHPSLLSSVVAASLDLLASIAGNVFAVDRGDPGWRWVGVAEARRGAPRDEAVREVLALAGAIAAASSVERVVVDRRRINAELLRIAHGVALHHDPSAVLAFAVTTAPDVTSREVIARAANRVFGRLPGTSAVYVRAATEEVAAMQSRVEQVVAPPRPETLRPSRLASSTRGSGEMLSAKPSVILRTIGEPSIDGWELRSLAVPFVLSAQRRPMSDHELSEITCHDVATIRSQFGASSPIVDRLGDFLRLADGVWSDTAWMIECERRARLALGASDLSVGTYWVRELLTSLTSIRAVPYGVVPNRREWKWVDGRSNEVSPRLDAHRVVVHAALATADLIERVPRVPGVEPAPTVAMLHTISTLLPFTPLAERSGASSVLSWQVLHAAALRVARHDAALTAAIQTDSAWLDALPRTPTRMTDA